MKKNRSFAVIYMFIVTAFFSAIVIGFSEYTDERVKANQSFAYERAVLSVLPDIDLKGKSQMQMHNIFVEELEEPSEKTHGAYVFQKNGRLTYALPFQGQGFWAPIKGVIGIDPDTLKVTGIEFYEQNETPGLGARIEDEEFKDQFDQLKLFANETPIEMKRPGEQLDTGQVHAVTGATQTSVRLERIINDALQSWKEKMNLD